MIVAARVESALSKDEILELYLNSVYLGRSSWGIELAARSYFGKPAHELTLEEGAFLAGLTKGPNFFNPDRHPARARERLAYVLSRMREDGMLDAAKAEPSRPGSRSCRRWWPMSGRAATSASTSSIRSPAKPNRSPGSTRSRPIPNGALHRSIRNCSGRSRRRCRRRFRATNATPAGCSSAVPRQISPRPFNASRPTANTTDKRPPWQQALANARLPLYDVHWTPAVVVEKPSGKKGEAWRVGLADGRILPALARQRGGAAQARAQRRRPRPPGRGQRQRRPRAQNFACGRRCRARWSCWRTRPAAFWRWRADSPIRLSQLNRATQAARQPGSAIKPLSYLAALGNGLQPNTLVSDDEITLPPIGGGTPRQGRRTTGRRKTMTAAAAARSPCAGRWKTPATSPPRTCSTAASRTRRKRASTGCASWRWRHRSTANACGTIRSCSARSRCGRSISQPSTRRSPMKACGRRPM